MNLNKLLESESDFLLLHPEGFESESLTIIAKKHKFPQMVEFAHKTFMKSKLKNNNETIDNIMKFITRSSMISVFEKVKFKDVVKSMDNRERKNLVVGVKELLHGDEEIGFNIMVEVLTPYKLVKWTIITAFRCYYTPTTDLLVKPTTTKNIIFSYDLEGVAYKPKPSFEFYQNYRRIIIEMSKQCNETLSPSLAAFTGFLMFSM